MFYLGELNVLYVLVPWEHQDFYNVKGGNIWIFSQQLCPNLLIPKIKKKNIVQSWYMGMLWYSTVDTMSLYLS